jgi:hypothetical protein
MEDKRNFTKKEQDLRYALRVFSAWLCYAPLAMWLSWLSLHGVGAFDHGPWWALLLVPIALINTLVDFPLSLGYPFMGAKNVLEITWPEAILVVLASIACAVTVRSLVNYMVDYVFEGLAFFRARKNKYNDL